MRSIKGEENWIESARQGDLEAFNSLVLAYQDRVYNQAYRMLGSSQAAEDAAQQAFLAAFQKIHQFRGDNFRAWLLRIVINLCYDELRRNKRQFTVPLEPMDSDGEEIEEPRWLADPGESLEETIERAELNFLLQKALNALPPYLREVIVLVDIQDFKYEEAAEIAGVPIGTVKSRLARGRTALSAYLKASGYFNPPRRAVGRVF
jgi:RNA polymerase sigma-70 factor (ECF subfamily)